MARALGAGLVAALLLCLPGLAGNAGAQDGDLDEILQGFDDEADDLQTVLEGFEDDDEQDLEDVLEGFESDDLGDADVGDEEAQPEARRSWDLTGSTSAGLSYNYLGHHSERKDTQYKGVQRLRTRLNLQLDVDLPYDWKARVAGFAFYDWAYLINGRHDYTRGVRNQYEWDADTQDVWVMGSLTRSLDLKVGRQVVNWGRSDTLRVLDVINPLDNREPGLIDIEDLRRPVGMAKVDYYWESWNLTLLAIPEIRFNQDPPPGSDFNPAPDLPPGFDDPSEHVPGDFTHWEWGAGLTGIFEGWDVSFHFASVYDDQGYLVSATTLPLRIDHNRLTLVGTGGNYTVGSWLLKSEVAWADGYGFTDSGDRSRLDAMLGVEYYGIHDTTVALEVAERHYFDFPSQTTVETGFYVPQEDTVETALRITSSFLNDRLELTGLGIWFAGKDLHDGSIVRLQAAYDIRDALVATAGILLFQAGDVLPLSTWGRNDRIFFELKYSF